MTRNVYIFLDIDGVLNCYPWSFFHPDDADVDPQRRQDTIRLVHPNPDEQSESWRISKECLRRLNQACVRLESRGQRVSIVLSSTWRLSWTPKELTNALYDNGMGYIHTIVGRTGKHPDGRGMEILEWCQANGVDMDDIVVVDDIATHLGPVADRLVLTDMADGLTKVDSAKIVEILSTPAKKIVSGA